MVLRIMMHDGERTLKQQLAQLTKHRDKIDALYSNIGDYHKGDVKLQKRIKAIAYHVIFQSKNDRSRYTRREIAHKRKLVWIYP